MMDCYRNIYIISSGFNIENKSKYLFIYLNVFIYLRKRMMVHTQKNKQK